VIDRIIPLFILIALFVLGFFLVRRRLLHVLERRAFLHEFADRFARYVESGGRNDVLYAELTERVGRMQRELGGYGVMASYRPPFANYAHRNYQVVINMLPEYRQAATQWRMESQAAQYASAIRDVLLRYSGTLGELEDNAWKDLRSPVVWFRESVRAILASPFQLLTSLGILSSSIGAGLIGSGILRVASGLVALIALFAGIVQIITGWDATVAFVMKWLVRR